MSGIKFTKNEVINLSKFLIFIIFVAGLPSLFYVAIGEDIRLNPGLFREQAFATSFSIAAAILLFLNLNSSKNIFIYLAVIATIMVFLSGLKNQ